MRAEWRREEREECEEKGGMQRVEERSEEGGKRHASARKKGAGGMSPTGPLPRNDHLRDSAPPGGPGSASPRPHLPWLQRPRPRPSALDGEGGLWPSLPPGYARPVVSPAAFSPYSPGDPGRGAVGARGHLGGRTEGVRGSPRPGGHGGRPPQGGPSRRRPRSRAPRPGPGWGHGGGSALRRGAGRG